MTKRLNPWHHWAPLLALLLLTALGAVSLTRPGPADAEPYHQHVREAAETIPYQFGDWVGTPVEAPRQAVELLKPNAMVSRKYEHRETGESVEFLLVHCRDARDMSGHYPPNCYRAHGWDQESVRPANWRVNGTDISGMQYQFSYHRPLHGTSHIIIDNFMIMPDGRFLRDMDGVRHAAADYTSHFYGAAQIQLLTSAQMSDARREEIFQQFIGASMEAIDALRAGFERQTPAAP